MCRRGAVLGRHTQQHSVRFLARGAKTSGSVKKCAAIWIIRPCCPGCWFIASIPQARNCGCCRTHTPDPHRIQIRRKGPEYSRTDAEKNFGHQRLKTGPAKQTPMHIRREKKEHGHGVATRIAADSFPRLRRSHQAAAKQRTAPAAKNQPAAEPREGLRRQVQHVPWNAV